MGVDENCFSVHQEDWGAYFQSMILEQRVDNFVWELINIYGPVSEDRKGGFLDELRKKLLGSLIPCLVGGYFNLVRRVEEILWQCQ
jgi:hypothetical protein